MLKIYTCDLAEQYSKRFLVTGTLTLWHLDQKMRYDLCSSGFLLCRMQAYMMTTDSGVFIAELKNDHLLPLLRVAEIG